MRNEFFHVESVQTPLGDMDSQKEIAATEKFPIIWNSVDPYTEKFRWNRFLKVIH